MIEAVVLVGGRGTRLGNIVKDVPKPMLPVAGRPFLEYVLDYLVDQGVARVVLSVGHLADVVIRHFGASYKDVPLAYSIEEQPLGTGGAVRKSMDHVTASSVVVANGDTIFQPQLSDMLKRHESTNACITLALREGSDVSRYGSVQLDGYRVVQFGEKSMAAGGLMNAGLYIVDRDYAVRNIKRHAHSFEGVVLPEAAALDCLYGWIGDGYFVDIGIPEDYYRANIDLKN